jgi:hypothetical protein
MEVQSQESGDEARSLASLSSLSSSNRWQLSAPLCHPMFLPVETGRRVLCSVRGDRSPSGDGAYHGGPDRGRKRYCNGQKLFYPQVCPPLKALRERRVTGHHQGVNHSSQVVDHSACPGCPLGWSIYVCLSGRAGPVSYLPL